MTSLGRAATLGAATIQGEQEGTTRPTIRRATLILCVTLVAAAWLGAGAAAPARADPRDGAMREAIMVLRGLIDRRGADRYFEYPRPQGVRKGGVLGGWWPTDPWTGGPLQQGAGRGDFKYTTTVDHRHYRLVGYLGGGRTVAVSGGMPRSMMLAYDHRGEEGISLIREYVEDYADTHDGLYPLPSEVESAGAVGVGRYWPSNPWNHAVMVQRGDRGSFSYSVADDRLSYTLRLHRSLKSDMVLTGSRVAAPWEALLRRLEGAPMLGVVSGSDAGALPGGAFAGHAAG